MDRRHFLALPAGLLALEARAAEPGTVILTAADAGRIREALKTDPAADRLRKFAASALAAGPWSVTFHRPAGIGTRAGLNDYYSEGPYWWPDPKNPRGPYIRKDGERNPNRFDANRRDLGRMCETVLSLGMGAYFLGDGRCGERAAKVLGVWFLDAKTRMAPHLEFGQAVRGHNDGRGTGIIDTVSFIQAIEGLLLLERSGQLDGGVAVGMRRWFADYLRWVATSKKGLDEQKSGNNHATWCTAQMAAYAGYAGDTAKRKWAWDHYRNYLVPTEVKPDGSCPREEARTKSLGYSSMNLDAFSLLCRQAQMDGVDLWPQVEKCFRYLMPYIMDPKSWRKPQISPYEPDGAVFPALAALGLRSPDLLAAYRKLPRANSPWVQLVDLLVRTTPAS
jgi:hypothetical protein